MIETLLVILGALVLLFLLIKGHIRLTRRIWRPIFEEAAEEKFGETTEHEPEGDGDHRAWDEVR